MASSSTPVPTSSSSNSASANAGINNIINGKPAVEYKLKSSQGNMDNKYNVIMLTGQNKLSEFTPPIRLIREQSVAEGFINDDGSSSAFNSNNNNNNNPISRKKKKCTFKIISAESRSDNSSSSDIEMEENNLWILEDYDGQNTSTGRMLDQRGKYVFFINEGDSFRVVPINKWYKFTPRPAFKPLSIEEAEKLMTLKNKDRWIMSKINSSNNKSSMANADKEDLDYKEIFDDDDEGEGIENNEETERYNPNSNPNLSHQNRKLSKIGKEMKKIVRNESSSESESDPYKQSEDEEEQNQEGEMTRNTSNINDKKRLQQESSFAVMNTRNMTNPIPSASVSIPSATIAQSPNSPISAKYPSTPAFPSSSLSSSFPINAAVTATATTTSIGGGNGVGSFLPLNAGMESSQLGSPIDGIDRKIGSAGGTSRTPSPSPSNASAVSSSINAAPPTSSSSSSSMTLVESDIIQLLKVTPMRTKDLIQKLKHKLKDPQNKNLFREYIKKLANLIGDPEGGEDKLLELKIEYR